MYIKVEKLRDSFGFEYIVPCDVADDFFKLYKPAFHKEFGDKFSSMLCYDFLEEEFFTKTENGFEKLHPKVIEIKMFMNGKYFDWDLYLFIPDSILEEFEADVKLLRDKSITDEEFEKKYSKYDVDFFNSVYKKEEK